MRPGCPGITAVTNFRPEDVPKSNIARDELLRLAEAHGIGPEVRELLATRIPPPAMCFTTIVRGAMRIRGISYAEICRRTGLSDAAVRAAINGTNPPRLRTILALSYVLGVHWSVLALGVLWEQNWLATAPGAKIPRMRYRHLPRE